MKSTHTLALLAAIVWSAVLTIGVAGIDGVRLQQVPGFPSIHQVRYYVYVPAISVAIVVVAWGLAVRWRKLKLLANVLLALTLLAFPFYFSHFTGGV
jgi:hypothetical protein